MKLLWLCNMIPAVVQQKIDGKMGNGLWLDHVLQDLRQQGFTIRILCRGTGGAGELDERCSFSTFQEDLPYVYLPDLEAAFSRELQTFQPDVIHVWGTEYAHSLAMVNAAEKMNMLAHLVINIQGLCSVIAKHYNDGVPEFVQKHGSFRDIVRKDNLIQQQEKFILRGNLEMEALKKAEHVIGRTHWDRAWTHEINPELTYHHCDETLRHAFYEDNWSYGRCKKHSIFAPGSSYPVKGFHYLLTAFAEVLKTYPDATLSVPGDGLPPARDWKGRLRSTGYQFYLEKLIRRYGLAGKVRFLGSLEVEEMKQAYLRANVFVLPSTIENSPNTLGEAMLLGLPCIASDVGGVSTLLQSGTEGFVYPAGDVASLVGRIKEVFSMEEKAELLGAEARIHALHTHAPEKNSQTLVEIYKEIAK